MANTGDYHPSFKAKSFVIFLITPFTSDQTHSHRVDDGNIRFLKRAAINILPVYVSNIPIRHADRNHDHGTVILP